MKKLAFILVAAIAAFFSAAACADDYPSRPITIVNVFGPGSGSDRFLASSPTSSAPHSAKRSSSKIARERTERWPRSTSIISRRTAIRS